jgi:hypothetical protein
MSERPDLAKLRRFALAIGLTLFIYSVAGVELNPDQTISPLGLSLKIKQPYLIGLGILIASGYASMRYWFFAMRAVHSPLLERRLLRHGEMPPSLTEKAQETVRVKLQWNQFSFPFESHSTNDINRVVRAVYESQSQLNNHLSDIVSHLFPGLAFLETRTGERQPGPFVPYDIQHNRSLDQAGYLDMPDANPGIITLRITGILLPKRTNFFVLYNDLDYTLPLWVNGIAIAAFLHPWQPLYNWIVSLIC